MLSELELLTEELIIQKEYLTSVEKSFSQCLDNILRLEKQISTIELRLKKLGDNNG